MSQLNYISNSSHSDAQLVQQYSTDGKQETLAELYLRYYDLVYGVSMKYLKEEEKAKDAVMNIYEELVIKLRKHEVENFKSWLHVLTRNHCLQLLRKNKQMPLVEFEGGFMQTEQNLHPDSAIEKEIQLTIMEKCIETLNNEQQTSIKLFYLQNKCYNEIVEETGIEWNKVRSLIQNGRRNLKICMEKSSGQV